MARLGRGGLAAIAVFFHVVYIYSIFDIYFVSPVVTGMRSYGVERKNGAAAPAKRLVLFVGDGLRADKAFQSFPDPSPPPGESELPPRPLAPFLRSRVLSHGTFGVSHTRVPTESRPGHVALIAGLYEDVSAVMTGWKLNPVNFDSVFNKSSHTWSWGSPDILPMFKEGAVPGRIDADAYGEEFEDFTLDATQLDTWVFDKVKALFARAKVDPKLDAALREDKIVFFLHLLGLDTTGHSYRPYSKEYLRNIKIVDQGVEEITKLIEDFYADGKTAYVFTADHGMSDWGSHGDGHPDNTRTPLIAWGSGVAKPQKRRTGKAPGHQDGFSADWALDNIQRHDVNQADVAALMAYLAGLEFPTNSVGELPLSYLAATAEEKAEAALANTRQILEMYRVKENDKKASVMRYKPYRPFASTQESIEKRLGAIRTLIDSGKHSDAIEKSSDLLKHGLQGLRYLQTYDWLFLRALITLGYLGWIAFALTTVIDMYVLHGTTQPERGFLSNAAFTSAFLLLYSTLLFSRCPLTYYAYAFFPIFFWEEVFARRSALVAGCGRIFGHLEGRRQQTVFALQCVVFVAILEALVQSYFHRIIFTVCYILGAFWPLTYGRSFVQQNLSTLVPWSLACLLLSTFTLLPVIKIESTSLVSLGGILMAAVGILFMIFETRLSSNSTSPRKPNAVSSSTSVPNTIMGAQIGLILLAVIVTRSSISHIQSKQGLPLGNQIIGWLTLATSLLLPFAYRAHPPANPNRRLAIIFLVFAPSFVILTISYEGLFYLAFSILLVSWLRLEGAIYQHHLQSSIHTPKAATTPTRKPTASNPTPSPTTTHPPSISLSRPLTLPDTRTALLFFFLLQSAFFSTGNIASVSSFSLDAVYRLIPIFDPFSQAALLLYKLLIPFALISAVLGVLNRALELPRGALFMVVMGLSDVLTLHFFWMVRDEGSWLDIGTSISHFFIGSLLNVFVAGLEGLSGLLVG